MLHWWLGCLLIYIYIYICLSVWQRVYRFFSFFFSFFPALPCCSFGQTSGGSSSYRFRTATTGGRKEGPMDVGRKTAAMCGWMCLCLCLCFRVFRLLFGSLARTDSSSMASRVKMIFCKLGACMVGSREPLVLDGTIAGGVCAVERKLLGHRSQSVFLKNLNEKARTRA